MCTKLKSGLKIEIGFDKTNTPLLFECDSLNQWWNTAQNLFTKPKKRKCNFSGAIKNFIQEILPRTHMHRMCSAYPKIMYRFLVFLHAWVYVVLLLNISPIFNAFASYSLCVCVRQIVHICNVVDKQSNQIPNVECKFFRWKNLLAQFLPPSTFFVFYPSFHFLYFTFISSICEKINQIEMLNVNINKGMLNISLQV